MSAAAVCGNKRFYDFFEDLSSSSPSPVSKKLRCSSSSPSPIRFSPHRNSLIDHLKSRFPCSEPQVLERALEECGNDLGIAIERLSSSSAEGLDQGELPGSGDAAAAFENTNSSNPPVDGAQWVDLFVREMMSATSVDDARSRASRLLDGLEKSISKHAAEEAIQCVQKDNIMLKEQSELLIRENGILKRAVAIQYERQKEFEDKDRELHHLKQMLSQYQEQLRTLEVNNYALRMHLKQAVQSSPLLGGFNPDIF